MTRTTALALLTLFVPLATSPCRAEDAGKPGELKALLEQHARQEAMWIQGSDARAYAALYAPDGDYRGPGGKAFLGRKALEEALGSTFKARPAGFLSQDLAVAYRFLRPDVALRTSVLQISGPPPSSFQVMTALVKRDEQWLLAAVRMMTAFTRESAVPEKVEIPRLNSDPEAAEIAQARVAAWTAATTRGDEATMRQLLHPAIRRVMVRGHILEGVDAVLHQSADARSSTSGYEMKVGSARFLGKEKRVLIYDGLWRVAKAPVGEPREGQYTAVLVKGRDDRWQTIYAQSLVPHAPAKKAEKGAK